MNDLIETDAALRQEAGELLDGKGLRPLLEEYGKVHISGSYTLELMVWRDLDIMLESPEMTIPRFFELGERVTSLLNPWKMFFTNNRDHHQTEYPSGLYWGVRLGALKRGFWKIDLWCFDSETCSSKMQQCLGTKDKLTLENRLVILELKSQLWNHPEYRDKITSQDIYDAALDHSVTSLDRFWQYIETKKEG